MKVKRISVSASASLWFCSLVFLTSLGSSVGAQQVPNAAPGFRADSVYDFENLDEVSLFNGALSVTIPIGIEYPVASGGFSYQLALRYGSNPWDNRLYSDPCTVGGGCPIEFQPKQTHNAGLGWRLNLPELLPRDNLWNQTTKWVYVGADGGEHVFYSKLHNEDAEDTGDFGVGLNQLVEYTRDGSYLRLKRPSSTATTATVELPDGHIHHFAQESAGKWRLTRMEDRYGNGLGIAYGTDNDGHETWTLADGHRSHVVTFMDPGAGFPRQSRLISKIEMAAFNSRTATYTFTYADKTVARPPAHNHPNPNREIEVKVLQRLELPAGTSYVFGSVANPSYQGNGMLTRMRLPTLGYLAWEWSMFHFPVFRTHPPNDNDQELIEPFNVVMAVTEKKQQNINGGNLGVWTYTRELDVSDPDASTLPEKLTVTVDRPSGDRNVHYFSVYPAKDLVLQPAPQWGTRWNEYSLPYTRETSDPQGGDRYLSSEIFDCSSAGNNCARVRSVYVSYALDNDANFNDGTGILFNKNRRLTSRRTLDHYQNAAGTDMTDWRLEEFSNFDGLGNHRTAVSTSNFGPQRTQVTNFNDSVGGYPGGFTQLDKDTPWLIRLYDSVSTTESGKTAKQEFCFDEATGSLQRVRTFKLSNGNHDTRDVIEGFTFDDEGQVTRQAWFGGDVSEVGTGDLCNTSVGDPIFAMDHTYAFGTVKTSRFDNTGPGEVTFPFTVNHTLIDRNTGQARTSHDPSGLSTTYTFDTSGRLTFIAPSVASGAAATKIFYDNGSSASSPPRVEVRELKNGSVANSDALTEQRYHYDGLGRLSREQIRKPSANEQFYNRFHSYDGEGRAIGVSVWGTNAFGTGSTNLDPFGRPRIVYPPDAGPSDAGHAIRLSYQGFRKTTRTVKVGTSIGLNGSVEETDVSRTEEFDAYGRLLKVTEPSNPSSSNGGNDVTTTYTYEVGDRLVRSSTPLTATINQVRTWTYDQRGFLTQECHPEKGSSGNGCVSYQLYDPRGQARRVVDGPFTRLYDYDSASRLTGIRQSTGGNRARFLKQFTYGGTSTGGNWALGKIVETTNYQYLDFGTGLESRMIESFRYEGPGGARSYRQLTWKKPCGPDDGGKPDCQNGGTFSTEEVFEHRETFDDTGKVLTVEYPVCTDRDDGCGPQPNRTVSYDYHTPSGLLTGISEVAGTDESDWVTGIGYHPNMTVHEIALGNGLKDVQGLDPHWMSRPASLHTEAPGNQVLWQSGTFRFDGSGSVIEQDADLFTDQFVYDGVSRLRQSIQWVAATSQPHIFSDGFESGDTSAWELARQGTVPTGYSQQLFTYDIPGNLRGITTDGVLESHQANTVTNQLVNATYDGAGNVTQYTDRSGAPVSLKWDPLNRLQQRIQGSSSTYYLYTADDERVMRFGPEGFVWTLRDLRGQVLREFRPESSGSSTDMVAQRDQIYRGDRLVGTVTQSSGALSTRHHYSLDHLGSPRLVTGSTGAVESEHKYYPFGDEATSSTQDGHPMKFTGHERDFNAPGEADDLDYMHARFCDPFKGRFLSIDPADSSSPHFPQTWNRYQYGLNNPQLFVDPDGRAIETGWDVANVAMGVGSLVANLSAGNVPGAIVDAGGLVLDLGATALPFVPGGASATIKAKRFANNSRFGRAFENAVLKSFQLKKNGKRIDSSTGTAQFRIPDAVTRDFLLEIKGKKTLSLTRQIRDFLAAAESDGKRLVIAVKHDTKISKSFRELVEEGSVVIVRFKPE